MRKSIHSGQAGRATKALLSAGMLILVTVLLVLLWEPWRTAPPDAAPAEAPRNALPSDASTMAAAEGQAPETTEANAREQVAVARSLRGFFTPPAGIWPGGGRVELHYRVEMPEGGFMSAMGDMMTRARKGDLSDVDVGPMGATANFERMFKDSDPLLDARVAPDGSFVLNEPPAGKFEIRLAHPLLRLPERFETEIAELGETDVGGIATVHAGSLLVIVSDPKGRPVSDAKLQLGRDFDMSRFSDASALQDMPNLFRDFLPRTGRTDARGVHRFEGIDQASWTLAVSAENLVEDIRPVEVLMGRENLVRVELAAGGTLRVRTFDPLGTPTEATVRITFPNADDGKAMSRTVHTNLTQGETLYTDSDGVATARGLPPGRAVLKLRTTGYLKQELEVNLTEASVTEADFRLAVGSTVSGVVLDENGAPVPEAHVMHMAMLGQDFMGMNVGNFVGTDMLSLGIEEQGLPVDEHGRFSLGGFEPGDEANLLAAARGFDAQRLDAVAGDRNLEFRLQRTTSVTGTVVAPDETPVDAFEVRLEKKAWLVVDMPVARESFTDSEGQFELTDAPRQQLTLLVTSPGFAEWSRTVDLRAGSVDLGIIELKLPAAIEGTTLDPDGMPLAGVSVRVAKGGIADSMAMATFFGGRGVESDGDGHFRIEGLTGKRVRLLGDKDGYSPHKSKTIAIRAGETTTDVVLQLSRGGEVRGRIVDDTGSPLPAWNIQLSLANGRSIRSTQSGDEGEFYVDALAAGTHKIEAYPSDYSDRFGQDLTGMDVASGDFDLSEMMEAALKWSLRDQVVVRENEESEIELVFERPEADASAELTAIEGRVRVGGQPLEQGMIAWYRSGSSMPTRMVQVRNGEFRIEGLRPGSYRTQVQGGILAAQIGRPSRVQVPLASTHRVELDLPGGSLSGRAFHPDGRPAAGVVLTLASPDDTSGGFDRAEIGEGTLLTGNDGTFEFDGLAAGTYEIFAKELMVSDEAGRSGRLTSLTLRDAQQLTGLELYLRDGGTLRVLARDSSGPRSNALVTLLRPDGKPVDLFHRTMTDTDGVATFRGIPEGTYRATVDAPRSAPVVTRDIEIVPSSTRDLDVVLRNGCEVEVQFAGEVPEQATGMGVAYSVWQADGALLRAGQATIPATTRGAASVRLGTFAPGTYRVRLEAAAGVLDRDYEVPDQPRVTLTLDAAELLSR